MGRDQAARGGAGRLLSRVRIKGRRTRILPCWFRLSAF